MLEPVSVALKVGFLAVLYLFLLWVSRSALKDLSRGREEGPAVVPPPDATGLHPLGDPDGAAPVLVVARAPGHRQGERYDVSAGATIGRGDVEIVLEDPFASSRHARLARQGSAVVLEDLGSTNGTYLNGELVTGPQPLHPGDRIRIGDSEFRFQS